MTMRTPFRSILIANRGEIAMRILRTAKTLGYRTVAVFSAADADAPHVAAADQAVYIGGGPPAESYLRVERIITAARLSGADAVHPGYGFLAENPVLPQACAEAGLVFIGPSARAMAAMADKAAAKALMQEAGVPCIPGYHGEDQSERRLLHEAQRLGFPIMIKATAGGGGRGMRLVRSAEAFLSALRSARSEAQAAFGDPTVLLERAIVNPHHIEIQVLADRDGHAVHLGERDCSVQRRHQKIIEEAPSPVVTPGLRAEMGAAAVRGAQAIGYEGAGTVEFLLDEAGRFYFMEMNTRLQVEHPVTECITGLDLVEWQLRLASGEALPFQQDEICFSGHAIEVRLCAEDPTQSFLPQSGRILRWEPPAGLRVDHALHSGTSVSSYYDSMIAKLIAHGRDREEARRRLIVGLEATVALGVATNQHFLVRCLEHPAFVHGRATTAFIGDHLETLLAADEGLEQRLDALGGALLWVTRGGQLGHACLTHGLPVPLRFERNGALRSVVVTDCGDGRLSVATDHHRLVIRILGYDGGLVCWDSDGVLERAAVHRDGDHLHMHYRGRPMHLVDHTYTAPDRGDRFSGDGLVRASMTGRVVDVQVGVGDVVVAGQPLLTLEAMKMEHIHIAPVNGLVVALHASVGDTVTMAQPLVQVETDAAADADTVLDR